MPFKDISYVDPWQSLCAVLVEDIKRKFSVKLFYIRTSGLEGVLKSFLI